MRTRWLGVGIVSIVTALVVHPAAAQNPEPAAGGATIDDRGAFITRVVASASRFEDRDRAIREGYRRLGPDFPGMGEHWVLPSQIVAGVIDADRPPVLSYTEIDGEPRLLGVAFTLPLDPEEPPPDEPFGPDVWHDHAGSVDEETLLLNHPSSAHGASGARMAMVHVWTHLENPGGLLAQNNWQLPFLRVGVMPPDAPGLDAARGLSLVADGRGYYALLLGRAADLDPRERAAVDSLIDLHASRVEADIHGAGPGDGDAIGRRAALVWRDFWSDVRTAVRAPTWTRLEPLAASEGAHSSH